MTWVEVKCEIAAGKTYLDKDNTWVRRDLVSSAVGDPVVDGKVQIGPQSPHNGIEGDARRSTVELGSAQST